MKHRNLMLAGLILVGCSAILHSTQDKTGPAIIHGPYLQAPSETGMTIVWFTDIKCTSAVEVWGEGEAPRLVTNSRHGQIDAYLTAHKVTLKDLTPGTRYGYRAVSREILKFDPYEIVYGETVRSPEFGFQTPAADKQGVAFAVISDQHEKADRLQALLGGIISDETEMVFLNGDMLDHFGNEAQIFDTMIDPLVRSFASNTPFILNRGNHETRGALSRKLTDYIHLPGGRYFYSFTHGPVFFICLDSGEDKPDDNQYYFGLADFDRYREEQARWLREVMGTPGFRNAKFRVVLMHMPLYGGNGWHGEETNRRLWGDLLNGGGIDLMISAHTHEYALHEPGAFANTFPLLIGSPEIGIVVVAAENELTVRVFSVQGEVLESFILGEKNQPELPPPD
jgi:hypothetical protein